MIFAMVWVLTPLYILNLFFFYIQLGFINNKQINNEHLLKGFLCKLGGGEGIFVKFNGTILKHIYMWSI